jgi:toxin ParE1/3/4
LADVAFRRGASADLDSIREFSIEQFGGDVARDYLDGLQEAVMRLARIPELGPIEPGIVPPIRALGYRSHRVYYEFDGQRVLVIRILHHAMNAAGRLKGSR